ncbi:MAG: hypothetical protein D6766_08780 [Verrucomicrobia bacterium]|nr:MAG: hypothetical protein D6766_08780 [Verrucomicrobiota bacterium]
MLNTPCHPGGRDPLRDLDLAAMKNCLRTVGRGLVLTAAFLVPLTGLAETTVTLGNRTLVKLLPDPLRPKLYALNRGTEPSTGTLLALDANTGAVLGELPLGLSPTDMDITSAGDALFVINTGSRTLMKIDLETFTVAGSRSVSTPRTHDPAHPLRLAVAVPEKVFFTDGAWTPGVHIHDFTAGKELAYFSDTLGFGGMALTRNGQTLFSWSQLGWSAGSLASRVTRYDVSGDTPVALETSEWLGRRDPRDTPVLLDRDETIVVTKTAALAATNLHQVIQTFPEEIYAMLPDGRAVFGHTHAYALISGKELAELPFPSTVQAVSPDQQWLYRWRSSPAELVLFSLAEVLGADWLDNQPPTAAFTFDPANPTTLDTITFDGGSSTDDHGVENLEFRWDWDGDGVFDTEFSAERTATHRYLNPGTKTVILEVRDRHGLTSRVSQSFVVPFVNDPEQPGGGSPVFELPFAANSVVFDPVRPLAYLADTANRTVAVLSLTNGLVEREFNFDWYPQLLAVAPGGSQLCVSLSPQPPVPSPPLGGSNAVARIDLEQQTVLGQFTMPGRVYDMLLTDGGLLILAEADSWHQFQIRRADTGELLDTAPPPLPSRLTLAPSQTAIYVADAWGKGWTLHRYNFDPATGRFLTHWDSEGQSSQVYNGQVWCHPDGTTLVDRNGTVFTSSAERNQDLRKLGILEGGTIDEAVFDPEHEALFTVAGNQLFYYNSSTYLLADTMALDQPARWIAVQGEHLFLVSLVDGRTLVKRLPSPAAGAGDNQPPVAALTMTPEAPTTQTTITFDASATTDDRDEAGELFYRWDWNGDGWWDTAFDHERVLTHRFTVPGPKTVILQVKDRFGASGSARIEFEVAQEDDPGEPAGDNTPFEVPFWPSDVAFQPGRPVAFLTHYHDKYLAVMNLTNGLIERRFRFDLNPEAIAVAPDGRRMYVGLQSRPHENWATAPFTNRVAEFDLERLVKTREFEVRIDTFDLAATDNGLLIISAGSKGAPGLAVYRIETGQLLSSSDTLFRGWLVALHPGQRAFYLTESLLNKREAMRFAFDPETGALGASWYRSVSPFIPSVRQIWCHPDGTRLITGGGYVMTSAETEAEDLQPTVSLNSSILDVAFDTPRRLIFTVAVDQTGTWLRVLDWETLEVLRSEPVAKDTKYVHVTDRHVFLGLRDWTHASFEARIHPFLPEPVITVQPSSQTNTVGGLVSFLVEVNGEEPLQYQWFFNGNPIPGATNATLLLSDIRPDQAGDYWVTVTNAYGSATSQPARLIVETPPSVLVPPQPLTVLAGDTAELRVEAGGVPAPALQWTLDGLDLPSATNATLIITNAQAAHAGVYRVRLRNRLGETLSPPGLLRVLPSAPRLLAEPEDQEVPAGSDVTFAVAFAGTEPMTVQWRHNGQPIPASSGPVLMLPNVQAAHAGGFSAVIRNALGETETRTATLTVIPAAPRFVSQPASLAVAEGDLLVLTAEVRGTEPIRFQWQKDGAELPGATGPVYQIAHARLEDAGRYELVAANAVGTTVSEPAIVTVKGLPPQFVEQPADATVVEGETVTLLAVAAGTQPIGYQWHFEGAPMAGRTEPTLVLENVTAASAGAYFVVASNAFGQATSRVASVTVTPAPVRWLRALTNRVATVGEDVELTVEAAGAPPVAYTWFHNGIPLPDQTGPTLALRRIRPEQAGVYRVEGSNPAGRVATAMTLFVLPRPAAVVAWGDDSGGQSTPPRPLAAVAVAGGEFHSLALLPDGRLAAWGLDERGQTAVPTALRAVAIAAGAQHNLALGLDGRVFAWGANDAGQTNMPPAVTNAVAIAAGEAHSAAALQDGSVVVWGDNRHGQREVPAGLGFVTSLAAGRFHTLALRNNGTVVAWGDNSAGQCAVPPGLSGVRAIAAGYLHSLALLADGRVVAWGDNTFGQTDVPAGLDDVIAVAAGDFHSCALRADGTVVVWGDDAWNQTVLPEGLRHVRVLGAGLYHGLATVAPVLDLEPGPEGLVLSWFGPYVLEAADQPTGPYLPLAAESPRVVPPEARARFFRLRMEE